MRRYKNTLYFLDEAIFFPYSPLFLVPLLMAVQSIHFLVGQKQQVLSESFAPTMPLVYFVEKVEVWARKMAEHRAKMEWSRGI